MCLGDLTSASVLALSQDNLKKALEKIIKCNDVFFLINSASSSYN